MTRIGDLLFARAPHALALKETPLLRLRTLPALLAPLVVAVLAATASPAAAEATPGVPVVTTVSPTGDTLAGSFTLAVDVDLNGLPELTLSPSLGTQYTQVFFPAPKTVTADQCPSTCRISWDFDTTSWGHAFYSTTAQALVEWWNPDGTSGRTGWLGYYDAPVEPSWISNVTRDAEDTGAAGYATRVFNAGGTVTATSNVPREADEVIDVRVYTPSPTEGGGTLVAQTTTTWSAEPDAAGNYIGSAHLNTSALPEGDYQLYMRPHNASGQWGLSTGRTLLVRHKPVVTVFDASPALQAVGAKTVVGAYVYRPMADRVTWSTLRVTVDSGTPQVLSDLYWSVPGSTTKPVSTSAELPDALSAGTHTITTEVLDTHGDRIGQPGTSTVRVVTFNETAVVPPLVLGVPTTIVLKGTAPTGLTYESCYFGMYERPGFVGGGGSCKPGTSTHSQSVAWTPQTVGAGRVEFSASFQQGTLDSPLQTVPVTVYARRSATLSAPTSSSYGTRLNATVVVRDVKTFTGSPVASRGVKVSLQRKTAGTSAWTTIATATTNTAGNVTLPFTNTVTGRLRAVVTSSVPGRTITLAERGITSVSTVTWSTLPSSVRVNALVTAKVRTAPYESGAKVQVQVRRKGSTTWSTMTTRSVASTGYATGSFRISRPGTWQVRVVRLATTQHATGYSTTKNVAVA